MNKEHIFDLIADKLGKARKPVIVCGHFQLMYDCPGNFVPGIWQDLKDPGLVLQLTLHNGYAGNIPVETFTLGTQLLKEGKHAQMLILVKDWHSKSGQWKDNSNSTQLLEYYAKNELPQSFQKALAEAGLSQEAILQPPTSLTYKDNVYYFSENALIKSFTEKVEFQSCSALDHICAQEQIPEYSYLTEIGCDLLVNFLPQGCGDAIFEAKMFSKERFPGLDILNIFCDGAAPNGHFWEHAHI